ncbi:hypothetical protein D3C81_1145260 [compost metagenome]
MRGNHIDQLCRQVDVRFLDTRGLHDTQSAAAGSAGQRYSGFGGFHPLVVADVLQAIRIGKGRQDDLAQYIHFTIAVTTHDRTITRHVKAGQGAGTVAVRQVLAHAESLRKLLGAGHIEGDIERCCRTGRHCHRRYHRRRCRTDQRTTGTEIHDAQRHRRIGCSYRQGVADRHTVIGGEYAPLTACGFDIEGTQDVRVTQAVIDRHRSGIAECGGIVRIEQQGIQYILA